MPNVPAAVVWIAAAKRLALPFVAVSAGTVAAVLADRLEDTSASVLASSVALLEPARSALEQLEALTEVRRFRQRRRSAPPRLVVIGGATRGSAQSAQIAPNAEGAASGGGDEWLAAEVLVERAAARLQGAADAMSASLVVHPTPPTSHLQSAVPQQPQQPPPSWPPPQRLTALWRLARPQPVEASHPLLIMYTSGSTGKPKGIVHVHGGYIVGLCATSTLVLGLQPATSRATPRFGTPRGTPADVLLVVATPGWITGQSYMIAAALLTRTPSILLDGSPVSPPDRFAAVIARHTVSVLKAGSTFLRMLMTRPNAQPLLARHALGCLRLGTFCAEPVNESVHRFACAHLSTRTRTARTGESEPVALSSYTERALRAHASQRPYTSTRIGPPSTAASFGAGTAPASRCVPTHEAGRCRGSTAMCSSVAMRGLAAATATAATARAAAVQRTAAQRAAAAAATRGSRVASGGVRRMVSPATWPSGVHSRTSP
jgi:acyl-CoA synthetase (AMP-forming)/AMP-acid ligase II